MKYGIALWHRTLSQSSKSLRKNLPNGPWECSNRTVRRTPTVAESLCYSSLVHFNCFEVCTKFSLGVSIRDPRMIADMFGASSDQVRMKCVGGNALAELTQKSFLLGSVAFLEECTDWIRYDDYVYL